MYDPPGCPFKFEKPVYANVSDFDSFGTFRKMTQDCWLNIYFPSFNGTVNLTYKPINDTSKFEQLLDDAHKLSYKHTKKADYIKEYGLANEHGVGGLLFDVGGDAASNVQFFLTDSTHHFVRGALYFFNEPNTDSMAPIVTYVKDDLQHILKTFEWKY